MDFKPVIAQVAFTPEREYGSRVIVANLLLLRVVADSHTNMVVASITNDTSFQNGQLGESGKDVPPNVKR